MSIYSGFATRFQQQAYDQYIDELMYVLQKRVIKFYTKQQADEEKFREVVLKLHHQLKAMEKHKYLEPKSSTAIDQLIEYFCENYPNGSSKGNSRHKQSSFKLPNHKKKSKKKQHNRDSSMKGIYTISSRKKNYSTMIPHLKHPGYKLPKAYNQEKYFQQKLEKQSQHSNPSLVVQQEKPGKQTMWVKVVKQQLSQADKKSIKRRPTSNAKYSSKQKSVHNQPAKNDSNIKKDEVSTIIDDYMNKNKQKTNPNKTFHRQRRLIRHMFDDYT